MMSNFRHHKCVFEITLLVCSAIVFCRVGYISLHLFFSSLLSLSVYCNRNLSAWVHVIAKNTVIVLLSFSNFYKPCYEKCDLFSDSCIVQMWPFQFWNRVLLRFCTFSVHFIGCFVFINILALSKSDLTNKLCCYSATLNLRRMGRLSKYKAFWRFPGIISSANCIQVVMYCNEVSIIFESLDFRYLEFHLMKNTRIFKRNDVGWPYHSICHNRHRLLKQKIPSVN